MFTTLLALVLIIVVNRLSGNSVVAALSGTTGLLLLCVFAVVNVACIVVRRNPTPTVFRAPTWYRSSARCCVCSSPVRGRGRVRR